MSFKPRPLPIPPIFPLDKGLVLDLRFDDRSGTVLKDRSGKGNNGTIHGASWVAGRRGSALRFDGVNDYVQIPHHASIDALNYMTIALWMNTDTLGRDDYLLSKFWRYAVARISANKFAAYFVKTGETTVVMIGTTVFAANTWYHVAITYNKDDASNGSKLYVNGVLEDEQATFGALDSTAEDLMLGASHEGLDDLYKGIISEVRMYNRALSASEIKRISESELMLVRH